MTDVLALHRHSIMLWRRRALSWGISTRRRTLSKSSAQRRLPPARGAIGEIFSRGPPSVRVRREGPAGEQSATAGLILARSTREISPPHFESRAERRKRDAATTAPARAAAFGFCSATTRSPTVSRKAPACAEDRREARRHVGFQPGVRPFCV